MFTFATLWEIPLVTIGDNAFPQHSLFLKAYKEDTKVDKERYFNKKLCSARVVTENCYGILKGRWRILHKNTERKLNNLKCYYELYFVTQYMYLLWRSMRAKMEVRSSTA